MTVQELIDELAAGVRDGRWSGEMKIIVSGDIFDHTPLITGYPTVVTIEQGDVAPEDDHRLTQHSSTG